MVRMLLPLIMPAILMAAPGSKAVHDRYDRDLADRAVPLLSEAIRFPTVAGNARAWADQKAWIQARAKELGFAVRDAGKVMEVDLPASAGPGDAPVLGLLVHGDVQPVDDHWSIPPFSGLVKDGQILGRGAADDKGPMIQALLAMKALQEAGPARTSTIRLLVGSDEESANTDIADYLKTNQPPAFSLVLDSDFPVVVGEKGWNLLTVATSRPSAPTPDHPWTVTALEAGLTPSIVPDQATLRLSAGDEGPLLALRKRLERIPPDPGCRATFKVEAAPGTGGASLTVTVMGRAAHGGVNLEGGRNALVALAKVVAGELPPGGADDLLAFARQAGEDLYGTGLGLTGTDPLWGRCAVNVATLKPGKDGSLTLATNIRATPRLYGPALETHLRKVVAAFGATRHAGLEAGGFFGDPPLAFDPTSRLVRRLMADYVRATGRRDKLAISGGGTYAKSMPRAIAFGMWFPGKPYPGHDVDEQLPIADLHRGVHVLIEALADLACGTPLKEPFLP